MQFEPYTASVLLILFFSTFVRSAFGFGDALIAMPLLAVVVGIRTATPLVALFASTIALTILMRNWRSVRIKSAWRLIVSTIVGIPIGLLFLKGVYEGALRIVLGIVLTAFSLYQLAKPQLHMLKNERSAYCFGFIAGILGGAYNTNGPPIVVYGSLRRWPPAVFRATLQGYFFPTGLFILAGHGLDGLWTRAVFHYYLLGLPVVLLSIWLGGRLHHAIPKGKFDNYIYGLLMFIGLALIVQTFYSMG